ADFNILMGSNKGTWKFVETHEDYDFLERFKILFEKNKNLPVSSDQESIPKVMHFIWVGPNPFPKESIENIDSWVEHHPEWKFKFWTDRLRPLPNKKMELHLISDFSFKELKHAYEVSDNYAEKSDLLRYEILSQEGGLYVDHDVKCYKPFTPFHYQYDLYCGLEVPHQPVFSSSISVCNNIIGVCPSHPILGKVIERVKSHWQEYSEAYPGSDKESVIYRVGYRTFMPFDECIRNYGGKEGKRDIVFPAAYFNKIEDDFAIYAHHYYASTWFEDETKFERNVRRRLISISRKNNQILLFNGVILAANVALLACLIFYMRTMRN
ncbi:MAG: hypothetical protein KDK60_00985, partial [Chlamydiia bacterium]|nr:hypothetical protein [Chlamydiia bacterium]